MTGRTHLTIGIFTGLAASYFLAATPQDTLMLTAAAALGSLLPDLDHPQSILSGYIHGSSLILNITGIRHRTITHSLLCMVFAVIAWFVATQNGLHIPYIAFLAVLAGIASHLVADMATPQGIPLLYPFGRNWKLAPGLLLRIGHGVIETVVWLASVAGIFYVGWLLAGRFA